MLRVMPKSVDADAKVKVWTFEAKAIGPKAKQFCLEVP